MLYEVITTFSHLAATTVLSRKIAALGIYPAVDPLDSTSRILTPNIVGEEHYRTAQRVKELLQRYNELQDIIAVITSYSIHYTKLYESVSCLDTLYLYCSSNKSLPHLGNVVFV